MRFFVGLVIGLAVGLTLVHMNGNAVQMVGVILIASAPVIIIMIGIAIMLTSLTK